jgi:hypothetical protein
VIVRIVPRYAIVAAACLVASAAQASELDRSFRAASLPAASPRGVRLSLLAMPRAAPPAALESSGTARLGLAGSSLGAVRRAYELSRFDCAAKGFGAGASLGLWLGALAKTTSAWDEPTSWYVAGAAAAAGTLLGGTIGIESEAWRTRYDWDD